MILPQRFESLIAKSFEKRLNLFANESTNCFRLCNAEGDGVPGLTIDLYGEYILMQFFSSYLLQETDAIMRSLAAAMNLLPVEPRGILLKNRTKPVKTRDVRAARESVLIEGTPPPAGYTVLQNGIAMGVDLVRGQSTGIFLDMREVRDELVRFYRRSDVLLNLFCYTAVFSVHAVRHGIAAAVNVDLSKRALERAKANYRLNGLGVDERDFIYGDALEWIRIFRKKGKRFSFIIFDPPTFSRNRQRTFSSSKNYAAYLALMANLIDEGYVLTSVNSYSISAEQYRAFHPATWKLELYHNESSDFTNTGNPYLKTGLWKIKIS